MNELALRLLRDARRRVVYPRIMVAVYAAIWIARLFAGALTKVDFIAFYTAGAFVSRGDAAKLYDLDAQLAFQESLHADVISFWVNPPIGAWAFAPLAHLSFPHAAIAYMAIGTIFFLVAIELARRGLRWNVRLPSLLMVSVAYFPAFAWVTYAQTSSLSLLLHVGVLVLLLRGRDGLAGLVLGLFIFKPQLAAALGLALIVARRWRAVMGAIASAGSLTALGWWLSPEASRAWYFGLPKLMAYVRSSATVQRSFGFHSLYGASTLLLDPISSKGATALAAILWIPIALWFVRLWWRIPWKPQTQAWKLAWAATIGASTLLSPHLYFYDLTCMLAAFYLLYDALPGPLLDDGPIAASTVWVWILGFFSPWIAMVMQQQTGIAIQLGTIAMVIWTIRVGSRALAAA